MIAVAGELHMLRNNVASVRRRYVGATRINDSKLGYVYAHDPFNRRGRLVTACFGAAERQDLCFSASP